MSALTLVCCMPDEKYDLLLLENEGFVANNRRTRLKGNSEFIKYGVYNTVYTSATGGIDYLYNPNMVVGGTDPAYLTGKDSARYVATFNQDSPETRTR